MTQQGLFSGNPDPTIRTQDLGRSLDISMSSAKGLSQAMGRMEGRTDLTANPYTGCAFACSYCYAAQFQQNEERRNAWGQWVRIKEQAPREIERMAPGELDGRSIFFGTVTDPYQPLEGKTLLTRRMLEQLASKHRGLKLHIQTRGPLVARDLDLLERIAGREGRVSVGMSIPTDSEAIRRVTEPHAPGIGARLDALAKVSASGGIWAVAAVSPLIKLENPAEFAQRLAETGAHRYWTKPLETRSPVRNGPPRSATRDGAWALVAQVLGCEEANAIPEYMMSYQRDQAALREAMEGLVREGGRLDLEQEA